MRPVENQSTNPSGEPKGSLGANSVGNVMPNGTVKFFNAAKGFGFITPDEKGKEIFLPAASLTSAGIAELKAGQRVSFEALPDTKGPKAVDLKVIADAQPNHLGWTTQQRTSLRKVRVLR